MSKVNEWNLLKHRFDALVHDESVDTDSIEKFFHAEACRRLAELINRVSNHQTTAGSGTFRKGHLRKT